MARISLWWEALITIVLPIISYIYFIMNSTMLNNAPQRAGELFWHARLLTASHVFVMDAILLFREGFTVIESEFARMPDIAVKQYDHWIPYLNIISFLGCL
jgi:hypothetical protein